MQPIKYLTIWVGEDSWDVESVRRIQRIYGDAEYVQGTPFRGIPIKGLKGEIGPEGILHLEGEYLRGKNFRASFKGEWEIFWM